jgi:hypothetical protein
VFARRHGFENKIVAIRDSKEDKEQHQHLNNHSKKMAQVEQ